MKTTLLFILATALFSFTDQRFRNLEDDIIGIWVHQQKSNQESLRYIRTNKLKKNTQGFIFHEDGNVSIYEAFGCQTPPHFKLMPATWKAINKKTILIDRGWPGEQPQKLKLVELHKNVLKFIWK